MVITRYAIRGHELVWLNDPFASTWEATKTPRINWTILDNSAVGILAVWPQTSEDGHEQFSTVMIDRKTAAFIEMDVSANITSLLVRGQCTLEAEVK